MADRSFLISEYLGNIGASVIYQRFLNVPGQVTKVKVRKSRTIPSVRLLSEQYNVLAIKKFHQIRNGIPYILYWSTDQMWTVSAILGYVPLELLMTQQVNHRKI